MDGSERRLTPAVMRSFQLTKHQVVNEKSKRDGLSPILAASGNGHLDVVRCLVKNGANINDLNLDGQTPLILAAKNGHQPLLRLLVNYGAKLDIQDARGRTALMHALTEGHLELARFLLSADASQAPIDRDGKTALFVAAECGHLAIVEHLLMEKTGADLTARDRQGRTVLMMLSRAGNAWPVHKYISETRLVDIINDRDSAGFTPLLHAAEAGKFSMATRLIMWGADVKAVTEDGRTVIMLACQRSQISCPTADSDSVGFGTSSGVTEAQASDQKSFLSEMINQGVEINAVDDKGRTALFYAAEYAELPILQHLLSLAHCRQADARDSAGNTVLHAAARMGRESVVRYLTKHPALAKLIDEPNSAAEMPVRLAIMSKNLTVVKMLLDCGASLNKADSCSGTPLLCAACENGAEDVVSFLLDRGFHPDCADSEGVTPLMAATRSDHVRIVKRLLEASASVNKLSKKGLTALTVAVQTVNIDICEILLNHKADPNLMLEGKTECKTLCSIAATLDSTALLELLVDFRADPFQMDLQGRNALYYSVLLSRIGPLRLLSRWSDLKHLDAFFSYEGNRYTLLHISAERGSLEVMKQLLNGTPSSEIMSSRGETPLHVACRRQDLAMVSLLTAYSSRLDTPRDGDHLTPLMLAGQLGNRPIILDLITKGADVNKRTPTGYTALNLAISSKEAPVDRLPLVTSLLKCGAKFNKQLDWDLLGPKTYNLLESLDRSLRTGSPQTTTQHRSQTAQSPPAAVQSKPKNATPMKAEERLKAKLKKKQLQPADTSKKAEGETKKAESFTVRAQKVRDEVQRTIDTSETSVKRISNMMKKYVDVTVLPDPQEDESGDRLAKELKKQDITRLYKQPCILTHEQMQQNRLASDFSKNMDKIRLEIVKKFDEKLDILCSQIMEPSPTNVQPSKVAGNVGDSSGSCDSALETQAEKRPKRMRLVRWQALYQLKYERKSAKPDINSFRSSRLRRLKALAVRKVNNLRRNPLPQFWEFFRQKKVVSRCLAPRMWWLKESVRHSENDLVGQFSYVRLDGVAAGVQGASVCWQPLPELPRFEEETRTMQNGVAKFFKNRRLRSQITQLTSSSAGHHCNLLVRCGQRPTEVKLFNIWNDKQMQLDLSWSLQPDLFHVRQRILRDRRPDIAVRLTVDTRRCLWDSHKLHFLADSLVSAPTSTSPDEAKMKEMSRQRSMLDCLMRRQTYHQLQAIGGAPQELDKNSDAVLLHPVLTTKLVAIALHVGLARSIEAAYTVQGDDVLLYQQPSQQDLKQLLGLLGQGRVKLIEARRFAM